MQLAVCGICRVVCFLFLSGLVSFAYFCWCYLNFQIFCITFYVPLPISSELNESVNTFLFVAVSCFQSLIICPKFISLKLIHKSPCLEWKSNNCKDANIPRCSQGIAYMFWVELVCQKAVFSTAYHVCLVQISNLQGKTSDSERF